MIRNSYCPILTITIFLLIGSQAIFAWGEKGHKLISKKSVLFLPAQMHDFIQWGNYISAHAADADIRKKTDRSEGHKHYIDIDYYKEFLKGDMIENEKKLIAEYGEHNVNKMGILPWATLKTYKNLVNAFKNKDKSKALFYASDLGHYVADGHQPMHTVMNYNGQLSGQKGVHARYEITMVDEHLTELANSFDVRPGRLVKHPLKFIFNYISGSNSVCDVLFKADKLAYKETKSREDSSYYKILWFRTKYITKVQFNHAAEDLASLIYTAWINGGKPSFNEMK